MIRRVRAARAKISREEKNRLRYATHRRRHSLPPGDCLGIPPPTSSLFGFSPPLDLLPKRITDNNPKKSGWSHPPRHATTPRSRASSSAPRHSRYTPLHVPPLVSQGATADRRRVRGVRLGGRVQRRQHPCHILQQLGWRRWNSHRPGGFYQHIRRGQLPPPAVQRRVLRTDRGLGDAAWHHRVLRGRLLHVPRHRHRVR
jgi:hypothetical protein